MFLYCFLDFLSFFIVFFLYQKIQAHPRLAFSFCVFLNFLRENVIFPWLPDIFMDCGCFLRSWAFIVKCNGFATFFVRRGGPNSALVEARVPKLATRRRKNMTFACVLLVFFWSAVFHRVATQARSRKNVKNLRVFRESGVKMLKNPIVLAFSDEPGKPPRAEPSARVKPAARLPRNPYK